MHLWRGEVIEAALEELMYISIYLHIYIYICIYMNRCIIEVPGARIA